MNSVANLMGWPTRDQTRAERVVCPRDPGAEKEASSEEAGATCGTKGLIAITTAAGE